MLPADMTGGASPSTAADLKVGADVLMTFKQRIDKLLSEFEDSAGSASKGGAHRVSRPSLRGQGSPFHEADALFTQYEKGVSLMEGAAVPAERSARDAVRAH